ncbi:SnoaL-like domain-containing protein [Marivivens donghaensis]|uniref:SnoaL-like domain-containing protein n=1 Tax=Marivivens donghaensis TaxID=1699413 RepID=A0ABX0VSZ9_9RHOB|nr:SnoaL-like domain-containing protein [Marivivens donghaensis]
MTPVELSDIYRGYIDCLNRQDWDNLGDFVHDDAEHNGNQIGLSGYRKMLERDFREIPDLRFNIGLLIAEPPHIAAKLEFDCTPMGEFFGLPINGKRVQFDENVFYRFEDGKVRQVWSVIDRKSVEDQL